MGIKLITARNKEMLKLQFSRSVILWSVTHEEVSNSNSRNATLTGLVLDQGKQKSVGNSKENRNRLMVDNERGIGFNRRYMGHNGFT